jgi:hypothetical protein
MMTMKKDENNEFSGPSSLTHFVPVQDTDRERGGTRALWAMTARSLPKIVPSGRLDTLS